MDKNTLVLTFGEIMMRLSPKNNLRLEQATEFDVRYGGAEANTALSLAYQGDNAAYLSVVPANRIGECALRSLRAYGVDTSRVVREGDRLGSYYFELGASQRSNGCVYDRKYSAINLASRSVFDWDSILEGVGVFYFSGVTPAVSDEMALACKEGLEAARARGIVTVCDVNYRGKMWTPQKSQEVMRGLLPLVDIVIANDEDAPAGLGMTCVSGSLTNGIEERVERRALQREEQLVDTQVVVELGVKGERELRALAGGDDVPIDLGECVGARTHLDDPRRADEGHRDLAHALERTDRAEAAELPAVGVALDLNVHGGDARRALIVVGSEPLGEQDEPGAGREHGHALLDAAAQRLEHAELGEELALRGRLAPGEHEPVEGLLEVGGLPQLDALLAKAGKGTLMLDEGALDGEDGGRAGH